ncbi:NDP-sugar synthase [bacterium]|jgi:NDP-sugar pyrophosphorylase family protein|nr:NDP-sugar synthase [bacterium]
MQAMLLSAGYGTRLKPITDYIPKPLMPILEIPLIILTIKRLISSGFTKIVINTYHHADIIENVIKKTGIAGAEIIIIREKTLLGSAGGIANAAEFLKSDIFFVINSDILFDIDFKRLKNFHIAKKALSTLVLRKDADRKKFGIIETDAGGRIVRFLGKPAEKRSSSEYMFSGIHVLSPEIFNVLNIEFSNICRDIYPKLMETETLMMGYEFDGYWTDIGTPANLFRVNRDMLYSKNPEWINDFLPPITPGGYYIGKNSVVPANTEIRENTIISNDCVIGDNCLFRDCLIFPGTKIPPGSIVTNRIKGNDFSVRI